MIGVRGVFLDRDGTINVKPREGDYITDPDQLRLLPGAAAAIAQLNRRGIRVAVVTNQRGVALGVMSCGDLDQVHIRLATLLNDGGAHLDTILACPHDRDSCQCRKPAPGLLLAAARRLGIDDLSATAMIGDSESDIGAGAAVGARTVLLTTSGAPSAALVRAPDLSTAVDRLLAR